MFNGVSKPLPLLHQLVCSKHHPAISCCCCCCLGAFENCSSQDMFNSASSKPLPLLHQLVFFRHLAISCCCCCCCCCLGAVANCSSQDMFTGVSSNPLPLLHQLVFLGEKFREGLHAAVGPASSSSSTGGVAHMDKQRQIDALLQRLCKVRGGNGQDQIS
jgi:hypothetical protein